MALRRNQYLKDETARDYLRQARTPAGTLARQSVAGGVSAAPAAPTARAPTTGERKGGFVNLARYLDANRGTGMVDKVVGGVEAAGNRAQAFLNRPGATQATQAQQYGGKANNVLIDEEGNAPVIAKQNSIVMADPLGTFSSLQPVQRAGQALPQMQAAEAMWAAGDAERKSKLGTTQGGREELVRSQYGKDISSGEARLDAAMLGAEAGQKFVDLSKQYEGLGQKAVDRAEADRAAVERALLAQEPKPVALPPPPGPIRITAASKQLNAPRGRETSPMSSAQLSAMGAPPEEVEAAKQREKRALRPALLPGGGRGYKDESTGEYFYDEAGTKPVPAPR